VRQEAARREVVMSFIGIGTMVLEPLCFKEKNESFDT
jgi:hypothetical protein